MKMVNNMAVAALLGSVVVWAGCSMGNVIDMRERSQSFWIVESQGDAGPRRAAGTPVRMAIVEFTVEFLEGEGPGKANFAAGMKFQIPSVLYQEFAEILPEYNRYPVPLEDVASAEAYQQLRGTASDDTALIEAATRGDIGVRFPADGLLSLDDSQPNTDEILRSLLEEIEADVALQVRLRVGVRDGRASVERGSLFRAVVPAASQVLRSHRTVVSALDVVTGSEEARPQVAAVDSGRFVRAVQRLFRPYISSAIIAGGGEEE